MQANTNVLSPEEFAQELAHALPQYTPTEQARLVEHLQVWALDRYDGDIPATLQARLQRLEGLCRISTRRAAG